MDRRCFAAAAALLLLSPGAPAAQAAPAIRIDQLGYFPDAPKVAAVVGAAGEAFAVRSAAGDTVLRGRLGAPRSGGVSSGTVRLADFSAVRAPGGYTLCVAGAGCSAPFQVRADVLAPLVQAALKAFYYQRASTPLPARWAGPWARPGGHPDDSVVVHPSAASPARPAGTVLSSPGGWYDAGDYNKYVVNSGISVATLLSLQEDFPAYAERLRVDIPESANALPDVLDEALWNLRWMLTMQDPADGGVYHKLSEATFSGFVKPTDVHATRWLLQKSTAATLDFAAVMAQASRVLPPLRPRRPRTGRLHPRRRPPGLALGAAPPGLALRPEPHQPGVRPGRHHGDVRRPQRVPTNSSGRRRSSTPPPARTPSWPPCRSSPTAWRRSPPGARCGRSAITRCCATATGSRGLPAPLVAAMRRLVVARADSLVALAAEHPYGTPIGERRDFVWGSNAVAANQGVALVQAYLLTGDRRYLNAAIANQDYLLGRNATGYSYFTGVGSRRPPCTPTTASPPPTAWTPPSPACSSAAPTPAARTTAPATRRPDAADESYVDEECAYAANEIAINWNAPAVYLAAALEAEEGK